MSRCGEAAAQAAALFALSGVLAIAAVPTAPDRVLLLLSVAFADFLAAFVTVVLPWRTWPPSRTVVLAWPAFVLMGVATWAFGGFASGTGPFFVLFFAWLGLHHRRRQILLCAPLATAAYAVPLVASGADPRIVGSTVILMPIAVGVALLISARVRALAAAHAVVAFQATHDPLTGLPNRAHTLQLLHAALSRGQRDGSLLALLFIDLDGFKTANDDHGHRAGDQILRVMAQRLKAETRAGDTVGRLGGDEFVVVLDGVANERVAIDVGERVVVAAAQPIDHEGDHPVRLGASVGIAFNLDSATDADALLHAADIALYQAKKAGRGRVCVSSAPSGPSTQLPGVNRSDPARTRS